MKALAWWTISRNWTDRTRWTARRRRPRTSWAIWTTKRTAWWTRLSWRLKKTTVWRATIRTRCDLLKFRLPAKYKGRKCKEDPAATVLDLKSSAARSLIQKKTSRASSIRPTWRWWTMRHSWIRRPAARRAPSTRPWSPANSIIRAANKSRRPVTRPVLRRLWKADHRRKEVALRRPAIRSEFFRIRAVSRWNMAYFSWVRTVRPAIWSTWTPSVTKRRRSRAPVRSRPAPMTITGHNLTNKVATRNNQCPGTSLVRS